MKSIIYKYATSVISIFIFPSSYVSYATLVTLCCSIVVSAKQEHQLIYAHCVMSEGLVV